VEMAWEGAKGKCSSCPDQRTDLLLVEPVESAEITFAPGFGRSGRLSGTTGAAMPLLSGLWWVLVDACRRPRSAKLQIVRESLRRGGGWISTILFGVVTDPSSDIGREPVFMSSSPAAGGFGVSWRGSHRVVDVSHCVQLSPGANRSLEGIRDWLAARAARGLGLSAVELMEPVGTAEPGRRLLILSSKGDGTVIARSSTSCEQSGARRMCW
jgi:hypothetical protein